MQHPIIYFGSISIYSRVCDRCCSSTCGDLDIQKRKMVSTHTSVLPNHKHNKINTMMYRAYKRKIQITDFRFEYRGYGHYMVTYTSPVTGKKWHKLITFMPIIDATRNTEFPKRKDLKELKRMVKE